MKAKAKNPKAHVSDEKKKVVSGLVELFKKYPNVAAINMENLPASQLQSLRALLRDKGVLTMTKRRLMKIAIEKVKDQRPGIEQMIPQLKGMPALMFTKENPFGLYKFVRKNKSSAFAKPNQTAPKDIVIKACATPFSPRPIISELGAFRLKTGVEGGKVAIKEDRVVAKEGEAISPALSSLLMRLNIKPMEIGINITAIYENGFVFERKILEVDEEQYLNDLRLANVYAMSLAIQIGYVTKDNIKIFVKKAYNEAKWLALKQNIMSDVFVQNKISEAERAMLSLKSSMNIE